MTSNNVNTNSYLVYLLTGGLNFQIEHHLFPSVNHCHLYKIKPIVKKLCKKYNISYQEYPTMISALKAHYQHIINMSVNNESSNNED
jgi:linoleoyl-CoA desaturase